MPKPRTVSFDPDQMTGGGLPDDFTGTLAKCRVTLWNYDGKHPEYLVFAKVWVTPDEGHGLDDDLLDDGQVVQHYSTGARLADFLPAGPDGEAVDADSEDPADWEGTQLVATGSREKLSKSSNWAFFVQQLKDLGVDGVDFGDFRTLEGISGKWDRIPQPERKNLDTQRAREAQESGEERRRGEILCLTRYDGRVDTEKKSKGSKTKAESTKSDGGNSGGDLDEAIETALVEALAEVKLEDGLPKTKLPGVVMKAFEGSDKAKAVTRVMEAEFLQGREGFSFDPDQGRVYLQ